MKKTRLMKKFNIGNKGVSLIEVIVSMLILMIIVVPLLSSFATARKSNENAKANIYARAVGESVVESVKLLGLEGTAKEFYKEDADDFIMASSFSSFNEILPRDEYGNAMPASVVTDIDGVTRFIPRDTGEYEYKITGVKQGVDTYDVVLKISNTAYSGSVNDYIYADLSAFNANTTAVINPILANSTYDYKALQYFKTMHERYRYSEYAAERDRIDSANAAKWEEYYVKYEEYTNKLAQGDLSAVEPAEPDTEPAPTQKPTLQDEVIKNDITKSIDISIETVAGATGDEYRLNSTMNFSCDNRVDPITGKRNYAATDNVINKSYTGYCVNQRYEDIDTLLVLYTPFAGVDNLQKEQINITKKSAGELDIYLVIQAEKNVSFVGKNKINVNISDDSVEPEKITLYSQADVNLNGLATFHQKIIDDMSSGDDTLYNINVEVFKSGTSDCIQTIKSTFVNN